MTRPAAILAMLGAVMIFGANFSISRYGTLAGLTPYDLVALRVGVGGLILLPFFLRLGARTCAGVGWTRGIVLLATGGFLMTLAMIMGLSFSPAAHGAALAPGTATTVAVVFSLVLAGRGPTPLAAGGLALIATGLALVAFAGSTGGSRSVLIGDALFVLSGLAWGFYPVLQQRWRIEPMRGTAVVAVLSLLYLPFYALAGDSRLLDVGWPVVLSQAVFQGVFALIVGLWLWSSGIRVLGSASIPFFPPLIPVAGTLLAVPMLGEWPGPAQGAGIATIVVGLGLASLGARPAEPVTRP